MFERLKDLFNDHDWNVDDTELTSGAEKAWFWRIGLQSRDEIIDILKDAGFEATKFTDFLSKEIHGDGFTIILQHPEMSEIECEKSTHMFLAVYRKSHAGGAYAAGFDC